MTLTMKDFSAIVLSTLVVVFAYKMDYLTPGNATLALQLISTATGGIFVGSAVYVMSAESFSRLDAAKAIVKWKETFHRSKKMQSSMAIISSLSAFASCGCLYGTGEESCLEWFIAGGIFLSTLPFTMCFIRPLNKQLKNTEKCINNKGEAWIKQSLVRWSRLHAARTLISVAGFTLMTYSLLNR